MATLTKSLTPGTLSDDQIQEYCSNGVLISDEFVADSIKQACYELRAGTIYYELPKTVPIVIKDSDYILVRPKAFVVIITREELNIPNNVVGRILTKGKLFSIGLLPVNTYADPGFSGRLGIVLYNASHNYLKLPPGEPIAKIEFSVLQAPVSKVYSGQHGYQTKIWPIPEDLVLNDAEVKADPRVGAPIDELRNAYGPMIAKVIERVYSFERRLLISAAIYLVATLLLVGLSEGHVWSSTLVAITFGVASNIAFSLLVYAATNFRRK